MCGAQVESVTSVSSVCETMGNASNWAPEATRARFGPQDCGNLPGPVDRGIRAARLLRMNRNKRKVKKANHGARPTNSRRRKARNRAEKKNG